MNKEHTAFAFVFDINNCDRYVTTFKLLNKQLNPLLNRIDHCSGVEFFNEDGSTVIILINDEKNRPYKIQYYMLGTDGSKARTIWTETDSKYCVNIHTTKDRKYIIVTSEALTNSAIYAINKSKLVCLTPIIPKTFHKHAFIDHIRDYFVIIAKDKGNYKLYLAADESISKWEKVYELKENTVLEHYDVFRDYIVLYVTEQGVPSILVYDVNNKSIYEVKFCKDIGEVYPATNDIYEANTIKFKVSSPFVYKRQYKLNLSTKHWEVIDEVKLSNDIQREDFTWEHLYPQSEDGVQIPLTLIRKSNLDLSHPHKLLIYTYGAYGLHTPLSYNPTNLAALEQDWVIAFSHIRGSNFNGPHWHLAGCYPHKPKSIQDFMCSLKYLYGKGWASKELTAAYGSSAGATIVGAAMNKEPNLFKAAVLQNPFLDVVGTLTNKEQALNEANYEEWGNPISSPEALKQIKQYCPLENIKEQKYPAILINYSITDQRIPYWGVMKYLWKMRMSSPEIQLVSITKDGGHFGSTNEEDNLTKTIWELAWLDYIFSN